MKKIKNFILIILISIFFIMPINRTKAKEEIPEYYSLYDDHFILNKYQGDLGTCWSFSLTRALETTLAKGYNEAFVLSEASLAARVFNVGSGEYLLKGVDLISSYGIAYESSFPYENIQYLKNDGDGSNYRLINSYLDDAAIKDIVMDQNIKLAPRVYSYKYDLDLIKKHLRENGGLSLSLNAYSYKENNLNGTVQVEIARGRLGTHALAVVGYDDTYKCLDGTTGALILLNSNSFHEGRSILYLPYSYDISYYSDSNNLIGINILDEYLADRLRLINDNEIINKASIGSARNSFKLDDSKIKDKNVFYDRPNLIYTLDRGSNLNVGDVKIYSGSNDITNMFNIEKSDVLKITTDNALAKGTYKIKINYEYKNLNGNIVEVESKREFYIIGGFMASFIKNEDDSIYYKFNTLINEKKIVAFKHTRPGANKFSIYFRPYAYNEAKYYAIDDRIYEIIDNTIEIFEESNNGYIDKDLVFLDSDKKEIDKYRLRLYFLNESLDSYIYTSIFYDYNNQNIDSDLFDMLILNKNDDGYKYYLPSLGFDYEYNALDTGLNSFKLKHDDLGYYLDLKTITTNKVCGSNYLTKNNPAIGERISYSLYLLPIINKQYELIEIPIAKDEIIYNGMLQSSIDNLDSRLNYEGLKRTNAGDYILIAEIKDKDKYRFIDGTTKAKIPWRIEKRVIDKPIIDIKDEYIYNGEPPFKIDLDDYYDVGSIAIAPGDYKIKITLGDSSLEFSDGSNELLIEYRILPGNIKYSIIDNNLIFLDEYEGMEYSTDGINYYEYNDSIKLKEGRAYFRLNNYNPIVIDIPKAGFIMPVYGYILIAIGLVGIIASGLIIYKRSFKK